MEVSKTTFNVFKMKSYFEIWCFIYDSQKKSGGGIMKGFESYLEYNHYGFKISDGWDTIKKIDSARIDAKGEFYSVPFKDLLKEAIDEFAYCYVGGEIGPNPVKK